MLTLQLGDTDEAYAIRSMCKASIYALENYAKRRGMDKDIKQMLVIRRRVLRKANEVIKGASK